eukprot:TRINITY_DN9379_c0_g1_i1.p1 TRINITY_DN9379_c0_g1~~TRINITY_DN9379_c0_g1_i1.p1  ORF type:complete len:389 (-),score=60.32 TRINITY_DN9379_c0_g1_i1:110-1276(-)
MGFDSSLLQAYFKISSAFQNGTTDPTLWDYPGLTEEEEIQLIDMTADVISMQQQILASDICQSEDESMCGVAISVFIINYLSEKEEPFIIKKQTTFQQFEFDEIIEDWVQGPQFDIIRNYQIYPLSSYIEYEEIKIDGCFSENSEQEVLCTITVCYYDSEQQFACSFRAAIEQIYQKESIQISYISVMATEVYTFSNTSFSISFEDQSGIKEISSSPSSILFDKQTTFYITKKKKPDLDVTIQQSEAEIIFYIGVCKSLQIDSCELPDNETYVDIIYTSKSQDVRKNIDSLCTNCLIIFSAEQKIQRQAEYPLQFTVKYKLYYKFQHLPKWVFVLMTLGVIIILALVSYFIRKFFCLKRKNQQKTESEQLFLSTNNYGSQIVSQNNQL